jgi:hypothetical protein
MKKLYSTVIPALNKIESIKDSKLFYHIDPDFENYGIEKNTYFTNIQKVDVLEITKDVAFDQMFDKKQTLTQSQILYFVKENREKFNDFYSTFFLFESSCNFFVAHVSSLSSGKLYVSVHHFEYSGVWHAEYRHRIVVPHITMKKETKL